MCRCLGAVHPKTPDMTQIQDCHDLIKVGFRSNSKTYGIFFSKLHGDTKDTGHSSCIRSPSIQEQFITLWKIVCKVCLDKTLPAYPSCPSSLVRQECPENQDKREQCWRMKGESYRGRENKDERDGKITFRMHIKTSASITEPAINWFKLNPLSYEVIAGRSHSKYERHMEHSAQRPIQHLRSLLWEIKGLPSHAYNAK